MFHKMTNYFKEDESAYYVELYFPKINQTFIGKCKLHEEDKLTALNYRGYEIAEDRAWIKFFKYQKQENNRKKKTLVDFQNSYCNSPKYEKNNYIAKKLRKEIYLCNQNDIYLNRTIEEFYQNILKKIYPSQTLSFYDTMLKISESWNKIGHASEEVEKTLSQINERLTNLNGHN